MKYDTSGLEFDLKTQRFLKNRWETKIGQKVRVRLIEGIKRNAEIRGILDEYVLEHPDNSDPYGHPYYPEDEMEEGRFWVLSQDDLRGISFQAEDFKNTRSLEKKALNYADFFGVIMNGANLFNCDLTRANFRKCNMDNVALTYGGHATYFEDCSLQNANFTRAGFIDCVFHKTNLKGVCWQDCYIDNLYLDNETQIDKTLQSSTNNYEDLSDLYRKFRLAYDNAEIWDKYDWYLLQEKTAYRKHILFKREKIDWLKDWFIGAFFAYGLKPSRILFIALLITFVFSVFYWLVGEPSGKDCFLNALYFSITTFSTLGYGDYTYKDGPEWLSITSALQAWIGAAFIASFVTTLMRKLLRR